MANGKREFPGAEMKTANEILACIERDGPISRAAAAKKLGLSRTTISTMMVRFIQQGLVSELAGDPKGRGRPGIPVEMNTSTWFSLGAEYFSNRWVFVLANLKGEVVRTRILPAGSGDPDKFVSVLIDGIRQMLAEAPGRVLPAVGVGAPGVVNWEEGAILRADDMGWKNIQVGQAVEEATGLASFVLNRNRAAGLAEARFGQGRDSDAFIYIGVGTGISAAVMVDGNLLHGVSYSAGEIGHMIVQPDGPLCRCGKRGCLQTLAAEGALVRKFGELAAAGRVDDESRLGRELTRGKKITGEMICAEAFHGDAAARESVRAAAGWLGMACGILINTFNPGRIIIGGPLVRVGTLLVDYVREEAARWTLDYPYSFTAIEASRLGEYSGALGAACLVLRHKLELSTPEGA